MSNDAFEHKNVIRKNAVVIKSTFSWSMRSVALAFILIQNWCHKHNVDMPVAAAVIVRVPINLNQFQCLLLNHLPPVIVLVLDMGQSHLRDISRSICKPSSLRWRHNEFDGVSDHQPHDFLLNLLFGRRSKKTSKLHVTGLCIYEVITRICISPYCKETKKCICSWPWL